MTITTDARERLEKLAPPDMPVDGIAKYGTVRVRVSDLRALLDRERDAGGVIRRLELRVADLLEILREWEPDYASAEHRQQMYFAREARKSAIRFLAGKPYEHAFPAETRRDQRALTTPSAEGE